ncbi:hypothetical protein ACFZAV_38655 [Streptomyces sp. NPDC008343]|uniref:hypothetical protein n=1 Tax=Streptomyces sp. NPDC008343 TaxID=3364828 RepID=UPI0036EC4686
MSTSEQPMLAVTVTFLPATSGSLGNARIHGSILTGSGSAIPYTGWLELMGELERLAEASGAVRVDDMGLR